jgi:hypothetical protein
MKKKRFSVEQVIGVLKQAEVGVPVAEVIRKAGISEQTFYPPRAEHIVGEYCDGVSGKPHRKTKIIVVLLKSIPPRCGVSDNLIIPAHREWISKDWSIFLRCAELTLQGCAQYRLSSTPFL